MTDYGHPIKFGVFVTPTADPVEGPVRVAVAADEAGLDLVTFQDHPYQAAFSETWTLLTFVAARTERIELAPNVANLPLRPPAVLARAAATLDRLTGGRFALGLGAGSFWDPIVAMGGPRRTPGEAVTALTEAIEVLRQTWDPAALGGVRVEGTHYRVVGAKRGPAPVRDIPIWLGAYGPRMLRLTGRVADGWLPSLSYMKYGDLARGNGIIDDTARAAGRDPAEIVRLLNVGPDASVADLTELAVTEGVSTFVVATDDEATVRRVAAEIAPAVRDAVAAARDGRRRY